MCGTHHGNHEIGPPTTYLPTHPPKKGILPPKYGYPLPTLGTDPHPPTSPPTCSGLLSVDIHVGMPLDVLASSEVFEVVSTSTCVPEFPPYLGQMAGKYARNRHVTAAENLETSPNPYLPTSGWVSAHAFLNST